MGKKSIGKIEKHKNNVHVLKPFCRTCLAIDVKMIPISKNNYNKILEDVTSIRVSEDSFPNWICYKCEELIKNFSKFRLLCLKVDNIINNKFDFTKKNKRKFNESRLIVERSKLDFIKELSLSKVLKFYYNGSLIENVIISNEYSVLSHNDDWDALKKNIEKESPVDIKTEPNIDELKLEIDLKKDDFLESNKNETNMEIDSSKHYDEADNISIWSNESFDSIASKTENEKKIKKKRKRNTVQISPAIQAKKERIEKIRSSADVIYLTEEEQLFERQQRKSDEKYIKSIYKCEMCILAFRHEFTLRNHMEKHKEDRGPHLCKICQQRFNTLRKLRIHKKLHATRYTCFACGLRIRDRGRVADHVAWHEGHTYSCHVCQAVFGRRTTLKNHIRIKHHDHHFKCDNCDTTFVNKERLNLHILKHSSPKHPCEVCGKLFYTVARLTDHMITHSTLRPHYCVECNLYFKSEGILKNHLNNSTKHIDPDTLQFACNQCDRKYRTERLLKTHIECSHIKKKQFSCEDCAAMYVTRQGLNLHRRIVHKGYRFPRSYICNICNKAFISKALLTNHIRIHTGEKPFECAECERKFSQRSSLKTHIKFVHSIKKPIGVRRRNLKKTDLKCKTEPIEHGDSKSDNGVLSRNDKWEDDTKEWTQKMNNSIVQNQIMDVSSMITDNSMQL